MEVMKTSRPAAVSEGIRSGSVTVRNVRQRPAPSDAAASPTETSIRVSPARVKR